MVLKTEKRPNSHLERFGPCILGQYKHMLEITLDRLTFQSRKKRPNENYNEYAVRWKEVASQVCQSLTNREINSLFVDTLLSPYYDKLIENAFSKFTDLLFFVGRIKDKIKRRKILDTGVRTPEKKKDVFYEHIGGWKKRKSDAVEEFWC